ncbi:hypothetical protein Phum_PHUM351660 [Pediculus humanus corporis]|uniref:Uncharacterized protein n=1 Tax=Pediculus humanus subsp. corporis TaxID=121224 RepID=E0VP49_PEDHC|nr:uncharacterized protein Phum_PHUM351660 [Pediculus humanus corporis]EEB15155.1 hypothetical protein Phum_PHUM351660 [Pediculus humanus corporis]
MHFKSVSILLFLIILQSSVFIDSRATVLRISNEQKYNSQPGSGKLNYNSVHFRHKNHMLHKKHYRCYLDRLYSRSHVSKQSRYPILDKIVNRLDNQIDRELNKVKMTTSNPFDSWHVTIPNLVIDKKDKLTYVAVGSKNRTTEMINFGSVNNSQNLISNTDKKKNTNVHLPVVKVYENSITFEGNRDHVTKDITTTSSWK